MGEKEINDDRNRRTVLKSIGTASTIGTVGLSGAASADSNNDTEVTLSRNIREATSEETDAIINSSEFEQFVKGLNIPQGGKVAKSRSPNSLSTPVEITEIYLDGQKFGETAELQTKYGEITAKLNNGLPETLILNLDAEEVPSGRCKQYSGGVGISSDTRAFITYHGEESPLIFVRDATESEKRDILPQIDQSEIPQNILVVTTSDGDEKSDKLKLKSESEIWVQFADQTYRFDFETHSRISVDKTEELFTGSSGEVSIQVDCEGQAAACGLGIVTAYPNCVIAGLGCSLSTVAAGGCILIALSICVPGGALTIADCYVWSENCT